MDFKKLTNYNLYRTIILIYIIVLRNDSGILQTVLKLWTDGEVKYENSERKNEWRDVDVTVE